MNKNTTIIILSSALIVALGFSVYCYTNTRDVKSLSNYENDRAFSELISSVSKMDTALAKSIYSTTPSYSISMLVEVYSQAETAKSNLAQLPNNYDSSMTETYEFISTVGDYSLSLVKKIANGEELLETEKSNIEMLSKKMEVLSIQLADIKNMYNNGETSDYTMFISDEYENVQSVSGDFEESEIEPETQEFATLIYDGPFSSHIDKIEPEQLKNQPEITKEQALKKVAEFLNTEEVYITLVSEINGQIPVYKFQSNKEDDQIIIDITKSGGHILNFINYRETNSATLDAKECVEIAKNMLAQKGFDNVVETYYLDANETVTINFAFTQNDIVLYPDLLKIEIYKDDGTLAGVEARGYIMSHKMRDDVNPEISIEQARKVISTKLEIQSEGMAIIPTSGKNEVLTYEFKCKTLQDENYIVYVNAKTGQIQNILVLIEDETGTLAM